MPRFSHFRRSGLTTLTAVLALTMLFGCAVMAYSVFVTRDSYIELRNASHASSLAGVGTLAHDDLLTNDTPRLLARITAARTSATQVAEVNQVGGLFISMAPDNTTNDPAGNIVFGQLDLHLGGTFTPTFPLPAAADPWPYDSIRLNAVRVDVAHPNRPNTNMRMYAHIDHNVIGFKPTNAVNIPMVPIALFSDTAVIPAVNSFENALLTAVDANQLNYTTQVFNAVPGPDQIAEVRFEYGTPSGDPSVISVRNLDVGVASWAEVQTQMLTGITKTQVTGAPFNGEFTANPTLNVPEFAPSPSLADFAAGFAPISTPNAAVQRIFPLYSGIDGGSGDIIVSGFIAARVVSVVVDGMAGRVTVTIQPTLLTTPIAVCPGTCPAPAATFNRYLGKLRLAAAVTEVP